MPDGIQVGADPLTPVARRVLLVPGGPVSLPASAVLRFLRNGWPVGWNDCNPSHINF